MIYQHKATALAYLAEMARQAITAIAGAAETIDPNDAQAKIQQCRRRAGLAVADLLTLANQAAGLAVEAAALADLAKPASRFVDPAIADLLADHDMATAASALAGLVDILTTSGTTISLPANTPAITIAQIIRFGADASDQTARGLAHAVSEAARHATATAEQAASDLATINRTSAA